MGLYANLFNTLCVCVAGSLEQLRADDAESISVINACVNLLILNLGACMYVCIYMRVRFDADDRGLGASGDFRACDDA